LNAKDIITEIETAAKASAAEAVATLEKYKAVDQALFWLKQTIHNKKYYPDFRDIK
jgi:hypothetical protein